MYPKDLKDIKDVNVRRRVAVERRIVRATVKAALDAGYAVQVYDGEETFEPTGDINLAMDQLMNTDEDYLYVGKDGEQVGWVRFIYGNDGWDVINDYDTNLEHLIGEGTEVDEIIQAEQ